MYSDFYDEKDDSDANLGQRSVSLVSELLGSSMWRGSNMPNNYASADTVRNHDTSLSHHPRPTLQQERKKTSGRVGKITL